ncbi:MAG: sugar phosphate isomerase/epimerase [Spirosoma sp.]|nr:sugar phosphate isomerase/epimerase [Spirosoma sp.]
MTTRRSFLIKTGVAAALAGSKPVTALANAPNPAPSAADDRFKLAIAGYSFLKFKLAPALEMMKQLDVHYLCIKDFHLPFTATADEITAFHEQLKQANVTGYGVGPIYMKTHEAIDSAFDYAKRVGVTLIVGIPNVEDLPYIEQKVKASNIRYAIHNHGPDIDLFPNAKSVYDAIKNLDTRMGLCFDMGHDRRYGDDPVADLKKYRDRIFDIHLKNVTEAAKEGKTTQLSRGIINIPAFIAMLRTIKYDGHCALEYEKDMTDPLAGMAESVGYFRGISDATRA